MTKEEAIALAETGWWKDKPARDVALWQLNEPLMCMAFGDFHGAVEEAIGRPVWTHEFVNPQSLMDEIRGLVDSPEDPDQHAMDSLAAIVVSQGRDPDVVIIPVGREAE